METTRPTMFAIGPNYSWKEAVAGMIAETIYAPLSAYATNWLIRP